MLDIYEGERPNVKFGRFLGQITVLDLPREPAGSIRCEIYLKVDREGLLQVVAKDLVSGKNYETSLEPKSSYTSSVRACNELELDPIEAERFKHEDYELVFQMEKLDDYLDNLMQTYSDHVYSSLVTNKIYKTKEWIYENRCQTTHNLPHVIKESIDKFLANLDSL